MRRSSDYPLDQVGPIGKRPVALGHRKDLEYGYGWIVACYLQARMADVPVVDLVRGLRAVDVRGELEAGLRLTGPDQRVDGHAFPQDVNEQLGGAIRAVFSSWNAEKAQAWLEKGAQPTDTVRQILKNAGITAKAAAPAA